MPEDPDAAAAPDTGMLLSMIRSEIERALPAGRVCVAFSGGVDSSLLARVCADMGYDVALVTVGFAGSHDMAFSRKAAALLRLPHHAAEIDPASFPSVAAGISGRVRSGSLSWIENCIAFHYISEAARSIGRRVVATGNGIDELFCGYDVYRREFGQGPEALLRLIDSKIENELAMMEEVEGVAARSGVSVVQPLLSPRFVRYARGIPLEEKITGQGDMMRKHAIRRLALEVGVPKESAMKRKKALQYGSRIHRALLRSL